MTIANNVAELQPTNLTVTDFTDQGAVWTIVFTNSGRSTAGNVELSPNWIMVEPKTPDEDPLAKSGYKSIREFIDKTYEEQIAKAPSEKREELRREQAKTIPPFVTNPSYIGAIPQSMTARYSYKMPPLPTGDPKKHLLYIDGIYRYDPGLGQKRVERRFFFRYQLWDHRYSSSLIFQERPKQ